MTPFRKFLHKDSFAHGLVVAIVSTALFLLVMLGLSKVAANLFELRFLRWQSLAIVGIFINLVAFRFYMVVRKSDRTGRGILLAMFLMTVLFFLFFHQP